MVSNKFGDSLPARHMWWKSSAGRSNSPLRIFAPSWETNNISSRACKAWLAPFLLAVLLAISASARAQPITTDPAFPTEDQPVTITFDATQANRTDLVGYTGEMYAHTGVIISEADKSSGAWSYVIASWTTNLPKARLTSLGDNKWQLQIDDIREYYAVPASVERIYQLAFVFRSADGSRQTEDLFVDLFTEVINVRVIQPAVSRLNPAMAQRDEEVEILAVGHSLAGTLARMTLSEAGNELHSVTDTDTLSFSYQTTTTGRRDLVIEVEDAEGRTAEASFYIMVNPDVTDAPRPEGIRDGINYHDNDPTSVTLSLFAPYKDFVYVIGDFNDWELDEAYFMNRMEVTADSVHWWITISNLSPGFEYGFQYFVDGQIRMGDVFSQKVLDPWNDHHIPASTYPSLKPYPAGMTEQAVSVLQTGMPAFEWTATEYERPPQHELVIYELLIRDFLQNSTYKTLTDTLDYLQRLGVNAIELMPVSQFEGNDSWGYNPAFHLAVDKSYGPADELKRFIDECHNRGIAVILDVVYNHATGQSPLVRLYGPNRPANPFLGPGHDWNVFHHLNHDHPYIQYWMDRASEHWLTEFRVDGFRFDLTKGFASNVSSSALLNGHNDQRIANLKRMADRLWEVEPTAYVILEHFAPNSEEQILAEYRTDEGLPGMMLWGNLNHAYNEATMAYHSGGASNFSWGYYGSRGWAVPNLITYMESHDEQWLMFKNLNFGNSSGDYDIRNLGTALDRQKLAGAFFFTIPGPKMIWQFGELGYGGMTNECLRPGDGSLGDCPPGTPGRTARKPIRWQYRNDPLREKLYKTWSALIHLRHNHEAFRSPDTEVSLTLNTALKRMVLRHESMDAVIIGNFGVGTGSISPTFPSTGTWYDFFTGDAWEITDASAPIELLPGMFHVFTDAPVETPEPGLITVSAENGADLEIPSEIQLEQNYPNPFNPGTLIRYSVNGTTPVRLTVFDVTGREIATLVDEMRPAGVYDVSFDASDLSSGMYFYRMETEGTVLTRKMTVLK